MQVCFLDHYDSFSFNLIDWLFANSKFELYYAAYDAKNLADCLKSKPMPLVLSPGPHNPSLLPQTMKIIRQHLGRVPILGICLGHQCLGVALGGRIAQASEPFHGTYQFLKIQQKNCFLSALEPTAQLARYNSLVIERGSLPESMVTAVNNSGEIEAIEWYQGQYPAIGLQFHPESFLSTGVSGLKKAWFKMVCDYYQIPF